MYLRRTGYQLGGEGGVGRVGVAGEDLNQQNVYGSQVLSVVNIISRLTFVFNFGTSLMCSKLGSDHFQ